MSAKITALLPAVLIRIFAFAGFFSAAILLVNAAKRAGIIPTSPFTQLAAPLAQVAAIGLVIGAYVVLSRPAGALATLGAALSVTALAGLVGVEFVLNLVFPYVDQGVIAVLRAGPLGIALTVVSMVFLLGTVVFMLALWRTSSVPKAVVILYTLSSVPIALRTVFPESVLQLGLVGLAIAAAFLAFWILRNVPRASNNVSQQLAESTHNTVTGNVG
ncbi:hypothetical protein [Arthrobacter sp. Alg241-R88]|uniref:hypothetical protein n=1 Tax=Arthrobacter sp. Alg241-R88 TaxID=2305984 RepID=UPI0019671A07|nr:hypothetical protein [Arthrobacter sp. Alg241-R88]